MDNKIVDVATEFGKQVLKYLKQFGLTEADLARLINSNTDDINDIVSGSKGVVLKSTEKIANVFGLRYFKFGDPDFPLPKINDLPDKTQAAINNRRERGVPQINRNYDNDLAGHLDVILTTDFLKTTRTAREIWQQLPEEVRNKISPRRITDLLGKSPRNTIVVKDGKRGREQLFRLKTLSEK